MAEIVRLALKYRYTAIVLAIFISIFAVALNSVMLAVDRRLHRRTAHDPGSRP